MFNASITALDTASGLSPPPHVPRPKDGIKYPVFKVIPEVEAGSGGGTLPSFGDEMADEDRRLDKEAIPF